MDRFFSQDSTHDNDIKNESQNANGESVIENK
jgi:hypothetical protein